MAQDSATNLCKDALINIRAIDPRETPDSDDLDTVWREFKRMIKQWGIKGSVVWESLKTQHTLSAGTQTYTVGSGGTINIARPNRILRGTYIKENGIDHLVTIVDQVRFNAIASKNAGVPDAPSLLWYDPQYPLGIINLFPAGGGTLYLRSAQPLAEPAAIGNDVVFPDEYQDAITWNLTMRIHPKFKGPPDAYTMAMAQQTLEEIENLNVANDYGEADNELTMLDDGYASFSIDAGA